MESLSSLLNILILFGAFQAFVIALLVFFSEQKTKGDNFFATLLLLIAMACLNIYLLDEGVGESSDVFIILAIILPTVVIMPVGPLAYFYIKSLSDPDFKFERKDRSHFYPVILDLIPSIAGIMILLGMLLNSVTSSQQKASQEIIDLYNIYVDIPRWAVTTIYLLAARRQFLNAKTISSAWPYHFINAFLIFQVIWLIYLIPYVIPSLSSHLLNYLGWYPIYIPLSVLAYWLSIRGYIFKKTNKFRKSSEVPDPELIEQITIQLKSAMMNDRMFLNPALTLEDLAAHIGVRPKQVSQVLNSGLNKNFNEFVNEFRVEEVKRRLRNPDFARLTITGIALECGFNSQPTFQRTFKQFTGMTPREFQTNSERKTV